MNNITFLHYQKQFQTSSLTDGFNFLRLGVRRVIVFFVTSQQTPKLIFKVIKTSLQVLSYTPYLQTSVKSCKSVMKEVTICTNFIDGMQSIDGLLHFKPYWKIVVLNVSGFTLFVITNLTLAEKFNLLDLTPLKTTLAAIPVSGVLPFGGLLHTALLGLFSIFFLFSLDKKQKLQEIEKKIKETKMTYWQHPLTLEKIRARQLKYQGKIDELQEMIQQKQQLVAEGKQIEAQLVSSLASAPNRLKVCQKALATLTSLLAKEETELKTWENKRGQWNMLVVNLSSLDSQVIDYQNHKLDKWNVKLKKVSLEKSVNQLSLINNIVSLTRQSLFMGVMITGYGFKILNTANLVLSLVSTTCSVSNYFTKKSIQSCNIRLQRT